MQRMEQALASIRHRGPDAEGQYARGNVVLGHRRLSILDLSEAGRQPMQTDDGRFVISYNGEVYNFRELARAHSIGGLRSGSDTEVVLRLFAQRGAACFAELNGMFAFALLDNRERKLWLVRDRLGIKPLYFLLDRDRLVFASEVKGIAALAPGQQDCDLAGLHEWLYFGNPLAGRTLYDGIRQLLPAQYLELDLDSFAHSVRTYWSVAEQASRSTPPPSLDQAMESTRQLLEQAVKRQLVADVPVGLFLSGGVDSSALTAFASRHYGRRLATYSAGFDFSRGESELPIARRVAEHFGTDHHEIQIAGEGLGDLIEGLVHHHDMPFADAANIPLALMASRISAHTKVVLQGDGGDELFCGYGRYFTLNRYRSMHALAKLASPFAGLLPKSELGYRIRRYVHAVGAEDLATTLALLLTSEDRAIGPARVFAEPFRKAVERSDPFARHRECLALFGREDRVNLMSFVDMLITLPDTFLEKVDRATMAASLEVRVPFLDHDLVDFAIGLPGSLKAPGGERKWLLKRALQGVVPDEVLAGRKKGLTVPYGEWLQGVLRPLFSDHLATFTRRYPGVLDVAHINRLFEQTAAGRRDDSYMLWKLMNLTVWANRTNVRMMGTAG